MVHSIFVSALFLRRKKRRRPEQRAAIQTEWVQINKHETRPNISIENVCQFGRHQSRVLIILLVSGIFHQ